MKRLKVFVSLLFILIASQVSAREFLNTYLHLNFGGMYSSFLSGDFLDKEESFNKKYMPDAQTILHYETGLSMTLDFVPMKPIILGLEAHAIKLGLRGSYRMNFMEQRIIVGDEEYENQLMDYSSWMIGPVLYYAPSLDSSDFNLEYSANSGFTFYALYGRLNGDLTSGSAIGESGVSFSENKTGVSGYKLDFGFGAELAVCSLNFGVNVYYSYINLKFDKKIYATMGTESTLHEVNLEIYVGIPIESFVEPLIPRF